VWLVGESGLYLEEKMSSLSCVVYLQLGRSSAKKGPFALPCRPVASGCPLTCCNPSKGAGCVGLEDRGSEVETRGHSCWMDGL